MAHVVTFPPPLANLSATTHPPRLCLCLCFRYPRCSLPQLWLVLMQMYELLLLHLVVLPLSALVPMKVL